MRVLIALDKFKEALPAPAACQIVADTLRTRHPGWIIDQCPLADGGDGFVAALTTDGHGNLQSTLVTGPLGDPVLATWALVPCASLSKSVRARLDLGGDSSLAVVEMAACSGLALVPSARRDVWRSTSRGVGELLAAAARAGAGAILLGIGGSATNDLGLGALAALGFRPLDASGREVVPPAPCRWPEIVRFALPGSEHPRMPPIWIACDVTNPLTGPRGATCTYGPQKGLVPADAPALDAELARVATLLAEAVGAPTGLFELPGAGAAGGIAGGLMAGLGARLVGGFELVSEWLDLERRVAAADIVITGEGGFDDTSLQGKGPGGLVRASLAHGKRTIVMAGRIQLAAPPAGLETLPITPRGMPLAEALPATARLLAETARRAFP